MKPKKVLVLKLGALGDLLMSTPALQAICDAHKDDQVSLLTSTAFVSVFKDWPGIKVYGLPRKGLFATFKNISWIRSRGFDRIYDLQSNDRSRLYCMLSGATDRSTGSPARAALTVGGAVSRTTRNCRSYSGS